MAAGTTPIYVDTPNIDYDILSTANATTDLSSNAALVFTAGADGGFIKFIRIRPVGTNVATKIQVLLNNGSALTATANTVYDEITVAATTASTTAAIAGTEIPMNIPLPAGWRVYCTTHNAVTAIHVTGVGGDY